MKIVFKGNEKIRLDKWLAYSFPEKSREFFNINIKNKNILLNDLVVKPATILKPHDIIFLNDKIFDTIREPILEPNKTISFKTIFEHDDFLIIEKPAGILTHPTSKNESDTIVNGLIAKIPEIIDVGEEKNRPGIVHRLDKETSGLLLIAKNNLSFKKFKEMFQLKKIRKTYTALVYGHLKNKQGTIDFNLARSESKFNRRKISFDKVASKEALTQYEVLKEYQTCSLVKVSPKTGRTHQIRVHFAALASFVVGDKEYGSKKINQSFNLDRHFLHACELKFNYKQKDYSFESPLPKDLTAFLKTLEK